jgi:broad specificity phosphatase PhoE
VLALVRHGETAANADGRLLGRADPSLTALGHEQADRLAVALAPSKPSAIVSSPLRRARQSAEAIADLAGMAVEVDERLVELDYGEWDGRTFAELPPGAAARWRDDLHFTPPGGESLAAVRKRVAPCCEELLARGGLVIAVSHVSPIKAAVSWALGVGDETGWRMLLGLASITRLELRQGRPCLVGFNDTAHLGR